MSRLQKRLQQRKLEGRKSFVAYLTAGDPRLEETPALVAALIHGGVDVIELGIPFSDPLADGPVNQRAAERALAAGASLSKILEMVKSIRAVDAEIPLLIFSYLNPILQMGFDEFGKRAAAVGIDGVLVVDLPPEEADSFRHEMRMSGLDTIFLASPTSDLERLRQVNIQSSGFVYYVSRMGVTGMQSQLSDTLEAEMRLVRREVQKPIMLGFGITNGAQAVSAAALADGIIIGSAIVKLIEDGRNSQERRDLIFHFAAEVRRALDEAFQKSI